MTWQTTFDRLGDPARRLLQRLAWLGPEPIPEALLDVPIADGGADTFTVLAELESYSLVTRAGDSPSFSVHRLVQEVTRRQCDAPEHIRLIEALRWIDASFVGDPQDVRNWPIQNPLVPHAQAVAQHADAAGITMPTARLMNQLGVMYFTKSFHAEAEPLMWRALAIDEISFGQEHPRIAICLNNLAQLLQDTNRLAEAEHMMRRALAIDKICFGPDHPNVARDLSNLARLLQVTYRLAEAEPLIHQALAIDEASFGPEHPNVAIDLNNLAQLLQATNRLAEAEPLMRRSLVIIIKSLGAEHPHSRGARNNYIGLLRELGRTEDEINANLGDLFSQG